MKPLANCHLYTIVDDTYLQGRSPTDLAKRLCEGGSDLLQLRAKEASPDDLKRWAEAILPITQEAGIGLVINDHISIAVDTGAAYCHLGQEDFFERDLTHVSQILPEQSPCQLGLSSHAPAQAQRAVAAGAAYISIGPVYATRTKPNREPVTIDYVRWATIHVRIPWFAIGGIQLKNVDEVLSAGARRICVVSAILEAEDIAAACRAFRNRLEAFI